MITRLKTTVKGKGDVEASQINTHARETYNTAFIYAEKRKSERGTPI